MSSIPYLIEKHSVQKLDERDFHMELMNKSMQEPYELKQIVPVTSAGETEYVYCVYAVNNNLIKTTLTEYGQYVDSKYLTGEQIETLKNIGHIDVCGENKEIENVSIKWDSDSLYEMKAEIRLK